MMIDRIEALWAANIFEPHTHGHWLSRSSIKETDNGYRARTNLNVVRTMQDVGMEFTRSASFSTKLRSKTASRYSRTVAWSWVTSCGYLAGGAALGPSSGALRIVSSPIIPSGRSTISTVPWRS